MPDLKKILLLFATVILFIITFASCNNKEAGKNTVQPAATQTAAVAPANIEAIETGSIGIIENITYDERKIYREEYENRFIGAKNADTVIKHKSIFGLDANGCLYFRNEISKAVFK